MTDTPRSRGRTPFAPEDRRSTRVVVCLLRSEADALKRAAVADGVSVSQYLRRLWRRERIAITEREVAAIRAEGGGNG